MVTRLAVSPRASTHLTTARYLYLANIFHYLCNKLPSMANIYIRTSKYVAAFMRAVGDGQSLPMTTPIEFSPYTHEYVVLTNGLRIVPEQQQHRASCYSQSAWQNMLRGRLPQGGKPIILRNPADYLSYAEICTLERLTNRTKVDAYEFLCIALPKEVIVNNHVERVNKSYTLDTRAAQQLRKMMREAFIRTFLDFETRNRIFAQTNGIHRSNAEILERFFMEYDMPIAHDRKEGETLRRLIQRWRKEAQCLATKPAIINDELIARIDEHEIRGGLPKYEDDD